MIILFFYKMEGVNFIMNNLYIDILRLFLKKWYFLVLYLKDKLIYFYYFIRILRYEIIL